MTYIIVAHSKELQTIALKQIFKKVFNKDLEKSPDIHTLDMGEKNSIGIEEIKGFQKEMMFKPFEGSKQIGIITDAEKLTTQAQNALLKTLENSSELSIYILCVNNERNLLPTIRSRGQTLYISHSLEENIEKQQEPKEDILNMDLFDQFAIIEKYAKEKESAINFISSIEEIFRKRLELDIKNGNIDSSKRNLNSLKIIQECREKISANCNKRLTLEAMIVQLNA